MRVDDPNPKSTAPLAPELHRSWLVIGMFPFVLIYILVTVLLMKLAMKVGHWIELVENLWKK